MLDSLRLDTAALVAAFTEAILYGVFLVLLSGCFYVLVPLHRKANGSVNWVLVGTAIALFVLATSHLAISFSRVLEAFIDAPGGAISYLSDIAAWQEVSRTGVYVTLTLVGDTLLIYRCWVVWGHKWLVIGVPIAFLLATAATGYGTTYQMSKMGTGSAIFAVQLTGWITSFFVISLAQNLGVTALITIKIWGINMKVTAHAHSRESLWPIIAIILESGAIYSSTLFTLLMLYVSGSNAQYIVLDMVDPIIGIVFSLIILRVSLRRTQALGQGQSRAGTLPGPRNMQATYTTQRIPLEQMQVNVVRHVDVEAVEADADSVDTYYAAKSGTQLEGNAM